MAPTSRLATVPLKSFMTVATVASWFAEFPDIDGVMNRRSFSEFL